MARSHALSFRSPLKWPSLKFRFSRLEVHVSLILSTSSSILPSSLVPAAPIMPFLTISLFLSSPFHLYLPPAIFLPSLIPSLLSCLLLSLLPAPAVPESALPLGMERVDGSVLLVPVEPCESSSLALSLHILTPSLLRLLCPPAKELTHSIVSLSMANAMEEGVVTSPSAGFLCM